MKTIVRNLVAASMVLLPLGACAVTEQTVQYKMASSFDDVLSIVKYWNVPANTLVVSDNDDTLTMMPCSNPSSPKSCQYLGGAAWFAWQQGLLNTDNPMKVANNFDELLDVSALLFSMNDMDYTQESVPEVLYALSGMGVKTMVATARGNENISATEQQFEGLQISGFDNLLDYFSVQAPNLGDDVEPNPYLNCTNNKGISFREGVMYLVGQNKGTNLKCFIHDYNQDKPSAEHITHLVFIDDTLENVVDVSKAFDGSDMEVAAIHYTALQKHKKAFVDGKMASTYQKAASERWNKIKKVLNSQLLESVTE